MWDYKKNLDENKANRISPGEMARKLYLSYPTCVFAEDFEVEFKIRDRVRKIYQVPISAIQVTGSAKTGFSLIKRTPFSKGSSDLDLAIIDANLFNRLWEEAYEVSNGFDANKFQDVVQDGELKIGSGQKRFLSYVQRGIISPDFLPSGPARSRITQDFARVTKDHYENFGKISAFFYANEFFFQMKQKDAINAHWDQL